MMFIASRSSYAGETETITIDESMKQRNCELKMRSRTMGKEK